MRATDLVGLVDDQRGDQPVGSFLIRDGKHLKLVIGLTTGGFHSHCTEQQADRILNGLQQGLQTLPAGERLAVHYAKFADDRLRQQELTALMRQPDHPTLRLQILSDKQRVYQLTSSGQRQHIEIQLSCTITLTRTAGAEQGHVEKALNLFSNFLDSLQPNASVQEAHNLATLLRDGCTEGVATWMNVFQRQGMQVCPLSLHQLWKAQCHRFNRDKDPPPLPQKLTITETGIREYIYSERHPSVVLTKHALPKPAEHFVELGNDYVGALIMMDKPSGFDSASGQLRFLCSVMAKPEVKNTELFVEFSKSDQQLHRTGLQLQNKQANTSMERAFEHSSTDVQSALTRDDTIEAQQALIRGDAVIKVGCVALVHRSSPRALDDACNRFKSLCPGDTWMAREQDVAYQTWLQTLPITRQPLLHYGPFNQCLSYLSSEATAFMPVLKPHLCDRQGIELIAEDGAVPIHLDFCHPHSRLGCRSLVVIGTTRSGKSVVLGRIILRALAEGLPVTIVDYPKADGSSTFSDFTGQVDGAYFDIAKENVNLLETPDLSNFSETEQQQRLQQLQAAQLSALMQIVIGDTPNADLPASRKVIRTMLMLALGEFHRDACIAARFRQANEDAIGSAAWRQMPTLFDFYQLLGSEILNLDGDGHAVAKALAYCRFQLKGFMERPGVGQALSKPSTIQTDAQLVVFAFTNVTDPDDAAILGVAANLMALRRSLAAPASLFVMDECSIGLQFEQVSLMVGRLCANGAKAGIRMILSGQDPDSIVNSAAGPRIMQNINTWLIGRIQGTAISSIEKYLRIPREVVAPNAGTNFFPDTQGMYSNWLLMEGDTYTRCRFYPSPVLLALTANNPSEQQARSAVMQQFVHKPIEGLAIFSKLLTQAIRSGTSLETVVTDWLSNATTD